MYLQVLTLQSMINAKINCGSKNYSKVTCNITQKLDMQQYIRQNIIIYLF